MSAVRIKLSGGYEALIDAEDFERVSVFKWAASWESKKRQNVYATSWLGPRKTRIRIRLHRFVLGLGSGKEDPRVVHHKNGDTLDCRKSNLLITTQYVNMLYAGVVKGAPPPPGPEDPFEICGECFGATEAREVFVCAPCRSKVFSPA